MNTSPKKIIGIQVKLFGALGFSGLLTLAACGLATGGFLFLLGQFNTLTDRDINRMTGIFEINTASTALEVVPEYLFQAQNQIEVADAQQVVEARLQKIRQSLADNRRYWEDFDTLTNLASQQETALRALISEVNVRNKTRKDLEVKSAEILAIREQVVLEISNIMDLAMFDVQISGEDLIVNTTDTITDLVSDVFESRRAALTIDQHLKGMVMLLVRVAYLEDVDQISIYEAEFQSIAASMAAEINILSAVRDLDTLPVLLDFVVGYGRDEGNLFELRRKTLVGSGARRDVQDARRDAILEDLFAILAETNIAFAATIDEITFDAVIGSEDVIANINTVQRDLLDVRLPDLLALTQVRAEIDAAIYTVSRLLGGSSVDDAAVLQQTFIGHVSELQRLLNQPSGFDLSSMQAMIGELSQLGTAEVNVFKLFTDAMHSAEAASVSAEDLRQAVSAMSNVAVDMVDNSTQDVAIATDNVADTVMQILYTFAAFVVVALVLVVVSGILLVRNQVVRPIIKVTEVMARMTDGDRAVELPPIRSHDQIGAMISALAVFKENLAEAERIRSEQDHARIVNEQERRAALNDVASSLEETVGEIALRLQATANQVGGSAKEVAQSTDVSIGDTKSVLEVAEQTSLMANDASTAVLQMSSAVSDIAAKAADSAVIAGEATEKAQLTRQTVSGLTSAAEQISTIIDMISSIAGQTNLLALNATIEAARAGEAGKGFAVVAHEVKALADQTNNATSQITEQIATIQSEARSAVVAIEDIVSIVERIRGSIDGIAAAVEEQDAVGNAISQSISQMSEGAGEVTGRVTGVRDRSVTAGKAADELLTISTVLQDDAGRLVTVIRSFVGRISSDP
jgi:methyl-accepting chemotaxis protein